MRKLGLVSYDHQAMHAAAVGKNGISAPSFARLLKRLDGVHANMRARYAERGYGFMSAPFRTEELAEARRIAASLKKEFRTLIVVGIGGSDLGARVIISALGLDGGKRRRGAMDIRFAGGNTDPDEIVALLADVDLSRCAINVVSKSGDTTEPMSTFIILRDRLIAKVGRKRHARHIVVTTDPDGGALRAIADAEGYRALPVPREIGGRFSALTSVGLLAAECAGIDGRALLYGAGEELRAFLAEPPRSNSALLFAGLQMAAHRERGQNVAVMMPYASRLREFGMWYRQLWAESLGKARTRGGKAVAAGQTPVAALGAADQHSQLQLWNDGPADKTITFIDHGTFDIDLVVPKVFSEHDAAALVGGMSLVAINRAEREATTAALTEHGRPNGTLRIPGITEASLGALMMSLMLATAAAGELLDVDAFDQPGVESMKRTMRQLLGGSERSRTKAKRGASARRTLSGRRA